MLYDPQLLSKLAIVFPRLRTLEITSGSLNTQYFHTVKNWNSVEKLVDSFAGRMATKYLELLVFERLQSLDVFLRGELYTNNYHNITKALFKTLHNAPSLKELTIANAVVEIADMEYLHARAKRLKHLKLNDARLCNESINSEEPFQYSSCTSLESISLNKTAIVNLINEKRLQEEKNKASIGNVIRSWIAYFGIKYPELQNLDLNLNAPIVSTGKELTTTSLVTALKNMKRLKRYSMVDMCYFKKPILDVMKENDVQLEHLGFQLDESDAVEETLDLIQRARPVSTLSSLTLEVPYEIEPLDIKHSFIGLCLNLKYLTVLKISGGCSPDTPILLVDILQNLKMLTSLDFKNLLVELNDDLLYRTLPSNSNNQLERLESLSLTKIVIENNGDAIEKTNLLFRFILHSCLKLKKIKLEGSSISARGAINLDFRNHHYLQQIALDMPYCRYYTFHHEFGNLWSGIDNQIRRETLQLKEEEALPYSVNLAWNTTKNIDVQLAGCEL